MKQKRVCKHTLFKYISESFWDSITKKNQGCMKWDGTEGLWQLIMQVYKNTQIGNKRFLKNFCTFQKVYNHLHNPTQMERKKVYKHKTLEEPGPLFLALHLTQQQRSRPQKTEGPSIGSVNPSIHSDPSDKVTYQSVTNHSFYQQKTWKFRKKCTSGHHTSPYTLSLNVSIYYTSSFKL